MTAPASSGCTGASWGSGFPLPALCHGAFKEDEIPWNNKVTCFSILYLVREYPCCTTTWRFVDSRRNKLKKKVKGSVQFNCSVVSDSLLPHKPQHARPPCSSPTPGVYPNSCLLSQWCHPTILSSVISVSSCPQSFPVSGCFQMSQPFASGGPKYWNFIFSISPSNEHTGLTSFRMDWLDLLADQGTLKSLLQHHSSKASILQCSAFFIIQLLHPYMNTGKTIALTRRTFVGKVISLLFNMLSLLVISFLPRSKSLLISWLQSPSAVILEPKK